MEGSFYFPFDDKWLTWDFSISFLFIHSTIIFPVVYMIISEFIIVSWVIRTNCDQIMVFMSSFWIVYVHASICCSLDYISSGPLIWIFLRMLTEFYFSNSSLRFFVCSKRDKLFQGSFYIGLRWFLFRFNVMNFLESVGPFSSNFYITGRF